MVLLVDHRGGPRAELRAHLLAHDLEVTIATDAGEALARIDHRPPSLVVVDAELPGGAIAAIRTLRRAVGSAPIVIIAPDVVAHDLIAATRAGADGYLTRNGTVATLGDALCRVLDGEPAISADALGELLAHIRRPNQRRLEIPGRGAIEFTEREWEILHLLQAGATTGQIAEQLFIAEVTVRTHIASIMHRLGVPDRASVIRLLDQL